MPDRQLGGERSPTFVRLLMVMALVCAAPLVALALIDLDPDNGEVTASGQASGAAGGATSSRSAREATQPTAAREPTTEAPTTAVPTTTTTSTTTTTPPTTPPPTTASPTTAPPGTITITLAQAATDQVLDIVNAERSAKPGCGPLVVDDRLAAAAQGHSDDMAQNDYFSHTSLDGSTPLDRAEAAGFTGFGGENIAMGQRSPEDVMAAWMGSAGHRDNILNCDYNVIGVGLNDDGWYWTQMFGNTS